MRMLVFLLLLQLLPRELAAIDGFSQLQQSYEKFFNTRYSLEHEFPFRLISVRARPLQMQPHTDVLKPLLSLAIHDLLPPEEIKALMVKSFLPLLYNFTATPQQDALGLSRQFATNALHHLRTLQREKLQQLLQATPEKKLTYTLFLAPYRKTDADLFYGKQKISMVRNGHVSLRTDDSADAQQHITRAIDNYRALLFYNYDNTQRVPTPLAAKLTFELSEQQATVTAAVLLSLYPLTLPYAREEAPVSLHSLVVPTGRRFRLPTALLSIHAPLHGKQPPQLRIFFGNFTAVKNLRFVFAAKHGHHYSPYLSGNLQKFKPLQVKFRFQELSLSLQTLQADKVNTVFSPGFKIASLQTADLGAFRIAKIDEKFKASINQDIAEQKDKLLNETLTKSNITKFVSDSVVALLPQLFTGQDIPATEEVTP